MDPARVARSWHRRLPGSAMLAFEAACRGVLPAPPAAAGEDDARATSPLERGLRARAGRARQALHHVKRALGDADLAAARAALDAARDVAAPLGDPGMRAWIVIFEGELALASGDLHGAAERSCAAERLAQRANDTATYLSVWWLRAAHALRHGDGGAGELMAHWMEPWLGAIAPRARLRLQCLAAAFAVDDERADVAIDVAAGVVAEAPGTIEAALGGSILTHAFLGLGRPVDAARVATSTIDRTPGLPPALAARLYLDAATALEATGALDHAERCRALAHRLDPDAARPASAADLAAVGIELRLL